MKEINLDVKLPEEDMNSIIRTRERIRAKLLDAKTDWDCLFLNVLRKKCPKQDIEKIWGICWND